MKNISAKQRRGALAYRLGHRAEALCRLVLHFKLYRLVAIRYKTKQGEVDIIALRGHTLAFIEVKARPDKISGWEAVRPRQQERLFRAAMVFLAHHPHYAQHHLRFDIMTVVPWRLPHHIENAFTAKQSPTF